MDERLYLALKTAAILLTLAFVAFSLHNCLGRKQAGDFAYHAASNYFADGHYQRALKEYEAALDENPDHLGAKRGRAETLIVLGREREALEAYDELVALQANNPGHYANRGIAYDRLGQHREALAEYEKALAMDPEVAGGPNWLTRFLRKQAEKPPGIAERAAYLKAQFALPDEQRILRVPEIDHAQRPYKE